MNKEKLIGAAYFRDIDATRRLPYEDKFAGFLKICAQAERRGFQVLIVASPEILGDDYEELVANLRRCSSVGMMVAVAEGPEL
jgi:hypothetical protein